MFRWYHNAQRCYVYLADVSLRTKDQPSRTVDWQSAFRNSRWFTRGWTLQELIAPPIVVFYTRDRVRLGDRHSLRQELSDITGISKEALEQPNLNSIDAEERFRWAERRQTSIEEDQAYCLLGIFEVFMPLIYGEGRANAMRRLRKEVSDIPTPNIGGLRIGSTSSLARDALDPKSEDLYVAVMGPPGTGKSSLIGTIVQKAIGMSQGALSGAVISVKATFKHADSLNSYSRNHDV